MDNEANNQENLTAEENINIGNEDKNELMEKVANGKFNIKKFIKTKKGKISLGIFSVIVVIFIIIISQYPMSLDKAYKEYSTRFDTLGSDEAYKWLKEEFDGKGLFGKKELVRSAQVLNKSLEEINKSFVSSTGGTVEDYKSVEISEVWFEAGGKYSEYKDINTKITNKSKKNIVYIKLNIYFEDSNGNVVGSDWTNDDSRIKPNATQTISKMIPKDVKSASVEIADIKFE